MPADGRLVALARRLERFGWRLRGLAFKFRRWTLLPDYYEWKPGTDVMRWVVSGRPGHLLWAELPSMTVRILDREGWDMDAIGAYAMARGRRRRDER